MSEMTGEPRWRALFEAQTARLFEELEETPADRCGHRICTAAATVGSDLSTASRKHDPAHPRLALVDGAPARPHR
jgi:hypothetical protein